MGTKTPLLGMKFYKDIPAYGQLFDVATILDQAMKPISAEMAKKCGPDIAEENSWGSRARVMKAYLQSKN